MITVTEISWSSKRQDYINVPIRINPHFIQRIVPIRITMEPTASVDCSEITFSDGSEIRTAETLEQIDQLLECPRVLQKERYTWKPSDEQITVLHDVAAYIDNSIYPNQKDILVNLYLQLKKLREE